MVIYLPNLYRTCGRKYIVIAPFVFLDSPTLPVKVSVLILQALDFILLTTIISVITGDMWLISLSGLFAFAANEVEVTLRWIRTGDYEWAVVSACAQVEADFSAATPTYRRWPFAQYWI